MGAISLTDEEVGLREKILIILQELREDCRDFNRRKHELVLCDLAKMGELGAELHRKLSERGFEPKHHAYMMVNRGTMPSNPEFYAHIHPVEDLLKFIDNPAANDDPVDLTINREFSLEVYTRRWGHHDHYRLKRIADGWFVDAGPAYQGECDKSGAPVLFNALRHDSVSFPRDLEYYIEEVWDYAAHGETFECVQERISEIGRWIDLCEQSAPSASAEKKLQKTGQRLRRSSSSGAITFMDVLGWKGIWSREDGAIEKIEELRMLVSDWAANCALESAKRAKPNAALRGINSRVFLISDTLVVSTFGEPDITLWLHGEIASLAICDSIERTIPLRGATCYGAFDVSEHESVFVGKAVDEAAEWHEQLDWIGVVQTPSAMLSFEARKEDSPWVEVMSPPVKTGKFKKLFASNWPIHWQERHKDRGREYLMECMKNLGPIGPSVASKILSTMDFYDSVCSVKN